MDIPLEDIYRGSKASETIDLAKSPLKGGSQDKTFKIQGDFTLTSPLHLVIS